MTLVSRSVVTALMLVAGLILGGVSPAAAGASSVGPKQRFTGLVNGNHDGAIVTVACPGPAYPGRSGHPIGGQNVAVILDQNGTGFTGATARRIVARFDDDPSIPLRIRQYGLKEPLPTDLALPCDGQGKVRFAPLPTSSSAVPDTVVVTYQNIAV
jgi:hypothetical protein